MNAVLLRCGVNPFFQDPLYILYRVSYSNPIYWDFRPEMLDRLLFKFRFLLLQSTDSQKFCTWRKLGLSSFKKVYGLHGFEMPKHDIQRHKGNPKKRDFTLRFEKNYIHMQISSIDFLQFSPKSLSIIIIYFCLF